jgi:hypothetical protein
LRCQIREFIEIAGCWQGNGEWFGLLLSVDRDHACHDGRKETMVEGDKAHGQLRSGLTPYRWCSRGEYENVVSWPRISDALPGDTPEEEEIAGPLAILPVDRASDCEIV